MMVSWEESGGMDQWGQGGLMDSSELPALCPPSWGPGDSFPGFPFPLPELLAHTPPTCHPLTSEGT